MLMMEEEMSCVDKSESESEIGGVRSSSDIGFVGLPVLALISQSHTNKCHTTLFHFLFAHCRAKNAVIQYRRLRGRPLRTRSEHPDSDDTHRNIAHEEHTAYAPARSPMRA